MAIDREALAKEMVGLRQFLEERLVDDRSVVDITRMSDGALRQFDVPPRRWTPKVRNRAIADAASRAEDAAVETAKLAFLIAIGYEVQQDSKKPNCYTVRRSSADATPPPKRAAYVIGRVG